MWKYKMSEFDSKYRTIFFVDYRISDPHYNFLKFIVFFTLRNYSSALNSYRGVNHTFIHTSEHTVRGSNEHVCLMHWAALSPVPEQQLELWCLCKGHFSYDLSIIGIERVTTWSPAQFFNHQVMAGFNDQRKKILCYCIVFCFIFPTVATYVVISVIFFFIKLFILFIFV